MSSIHSSSPSSSPPRISSQQSNSTPRKRKRITPPTPPTSSKTSRRLNTNLPSELTPDEEAAGSPRTKVAHSLQGLQIEDAGVSKLDLQPDLTAREESAMEDRARNRVKLFPAPWQEKGTGRVMSDGSREVPETPDKRAFNIVIGPQGTMAETAIGTLHNEVNPVIFIGGSVGEVKSGNGLAGAYPSINRLSDSKSRRKTKKRVGTPPLFGALGGGLGMEEGERKAVDEERAALTWHDDEATGHDPSDPEDDGEGINGIGFKPTPAMAYARTKKRRAAIVEYKNREAREARARRSARRRVTEVAKAGSEEAERRVRFLEARGDGIETS